VQVGPGVQRPRDDDQRSGPDADDTDDADTTDAAEDRPRTDEDQP
jgi:hypothetical protein